MSQTFLTRHDEEGTGDYDSIAWAFEVHVKQPDMPNIVCAILHGNEDSPDRIEFFAENNINAKPVLVWSE